MKLLPSLIVIVCALGATVSSALLGYNAGKADAKSENIEFITSTSNEQWVELGDATYGAQWRISPDADSMSVVHIFNNGVLSTWVGEPCNCY